MIQVRNLTRSYGDFKAVDDVTFNIGRGEVVGLLGHNGAGKTTIMKMLTGYLEPSSGWITINGINVADDRTAVQKLIGYLPENCPVYPEMTVIDYLEYQAGLHGVPEHLRLDALREAIRRTELEPKADKPVSTLSRGYRQRVGVAQAILHRPQILILDEPTNGLDPSQIQHMRTLIRDLSQHATVILSTHILQEVQAVSDRVLIIRQGRLAVDSRLSELATSRRLLVSLNLEPEKATKLLYAANDVTGVQHLYSDAGRHQYALELDSADPQATAPAIARAIVDGGHALYGLQPESRDLEKVFAEINEGEAKETTHA